MMDHFTFPDPSSLDAAWFAHNPGRRHRIRVAMPGDLPQGTCPEGWIIVKQVRPGVRIRLLASLAPGTPPDSDEVTARKLFEQIRQCDAARRVVENVELMCGEPAERA